ncbi:hypothetical protein LEMA_P087760.1 [Plenodomus lingam JN3]|uniref:Alpha-ionylideneethane synthase abl3 n=2 Tax=Leptosphaeria maculans TaxID=5022 RepID=ABL3_LEPMJ|nr:hypothetical protein LEMA_P087760.1 [Plenodomus lingam JN3]E5A7E2.1 RecName: Full=Alpha-ionylideneethane synthase abl3; AltName: Full=Abscisic acid biosynthesis cluster protein 3; AltName: Full=Sesquiterpene synthase abl3 [Plenodomus lingam JN3]CBX99537.1 hypothetical protein LEMA_P087760.1 [Plenodomus lingam JN3]
MLLYNSFTEGLKFTKTKILLRYYASALIDVPRDDVIEDAGVSKSQAMQNIRDRWYYPPDLANDLQDLDMPKAMKQEIFACAWEYTRCVIPQYTNWPRYVAFMRIIIIGIVAEFRGNLVDVTAGDDMMGYNLSTVLDALFLGTADRENMCREYRSFLLITADKSSERRNGELFRRYVNALAHSPRQWFRMRDADALARFTIAASLACNDLDDLKFSNMEYEILTEIGDTLYDAVAFFKHRSEGETNSTFAYMPPDMRVEAFHQAREVLWAMDVALAPKTTLQGVINFVRFFGGPIHMMMRRYRFVEEHLTIGQVETEKVVDQTRKNFKLWNRLDAKDAKAGDEKRYKDIVSNNSGEVMFPGLVEFLENEDNCPDCCFRESYGAETKHQFGGVQICSACREEWGRYMKSLPDRAVKAFPELAYVLSIP